MNYPFSHIAIIYNPNSTGDSPSNAKRLKRQLVSKLPKFVSVELIPTESAGHAEDLAREYADRHKKCLIISASGDGGYNEVVNGVIASKNTQAVSMVLPSGNANDHDRAIAGRGLINRIVEPNITMIDGIRLDATKDGEPFTRHAHSYVGFGMTAYIGKKLTEAKLNPVNEKWLVLKYMVLFRHITLQIAPDMRWHRYSNVIFSNVSQMSKVIKLAPEAKLKDDRIEMYVLRSRSILRLVGSLIFASVVGMRPTAQIEKQTLVARHPIEVQLDGEVVTLDANSDMLVSVAVDTIRALR